MRKVLSMHTLPSLFGSSWWKFQCIEYIWRYVLMHKGPGHGRIVAQLLHENQNIQNVSWNILGLAVHFIEDLQIYKGKLNILLNSVRNVIISPAGDCCGRTVRYTTITSLCR